MRQKEFSIIITIFKLKIRIKTNYRRYYTYLQEYFRKAQLSNDSQCNPEIEIDINWRNSSYGKYFSKLKESLDANVIGPSTFVDKDRIVTIRKVGNRRKMFFDYRVKDKKICLSSLYYRKIQKDIIRYIMFGGIEEELFFDVTYPILYYPVFWYSEYFLQSHLLHAGAAKINNKGVVICGLEGVGKTSLTLSLLEEQDSSFLSDNLVFYDNERVYPCYEAVRINKEDRYNSWKGKFEKLKRLRTPKEFYVPLIKSNDEGIKPRIFIFPEFSSKFTVERISKEDAVNKSIILSSIPAELSNYDEYRNLYNLLALNLNVHQSRHDVLAKLLSKVSCYKIGMPKSDGLEKNSERVKEIIKNAA